MRPLRAVMTQRFRRKALMPRNLEVLSHSRQPCIHTPRSLDAVREITDRAIGNP
jgi:hypothetical protein